MTRMVMETESLTGQRAQLPLRWRALLASPLPASSHRESLQGRVSALSALDKAPFKSIDFLLSLPGASENVGPRMPSLGRCKPHLITVMVESSGEGPASIPTSISALNRRRESLLGDRKWLWRSSLYLLSKEEKPLPSHPHPPPLGYEGPGDPWVAAGSPRELGRK